MSYIRISGDQFEINGEVRPYRMRTSFCLLAHYQRGERDKGKRWLDRLQAQGFDGPRLFGEQQDWEGGPFFGNPVYTPIVRAFGDHSGPFSKLQLVSGYKDIVAQLAQDLLDRNMVAEFCCIATVKGREPGWTAHGLNKFAQMFASLFPDPKNTPFLHETVNEIDAHSHPDLVDDREEWKRMGPRWLRTGDPSHYNYPGSTIGVSAGGQFEPGFDDLGYTHRNIHPPRGSQWDRGLDFGGGREAIGPTLDILRKKTSGRPLAFNETIHYMTQAQWDEWIPKVGKWASLSTTDVAKLSEYTKTVLDRGVSFCAHDMIGMSTDPDQPWSPMEEAWAEIFEGSKPVPKPKVKFEHVVRGAYKDILLREPDPNGLEAWNFYLLRGGTEASLREHLIRSSEFDEKFG